MLCACCSQLDGDASLHVEWKFVAVSPVSPRTIFMTLNRHSQNLIQALFLTARVSQIKLVVGLTLWQEVVYHVLVKGGIVQVREYGLH